MNNDFIVDEETSNISDAELENDSGTNEVAFEVASTTNVGSTRRGLHSLPTEIRGLIFEFKFLEHLPADQLLPDTAYIPFSPVLNVSIQPRRDAPQALCKEDIFYVDFLHQKLSKVSYILPSETVPSLQFNV